MDIFLIFVLFVCIVILCHCFYALGYEAREKRFQEKPITFAEDGKSTVWIGRESGIVKIRIYDPKKVEILKEIEPTV